MTQTSRSSEDILAEVKRNEMIREQARVLLRLIYQYKKNINLLKKKLNDYREFVVYRLQPDAIDLTLDFLERKKDQFSLELREEVIDSLIIARMNINQENSKNNVFPESALREEPSSFKIDCIDPGKEVCELIGSYVANLLNKRNAPKCRVYRNHKDQVKVALALGNEFKPIKEHKEEAQNFAEFFATSILVGDAEFMKNAAVRTDHNHHYWARINNDDALHYTKFSNGIDSIKLDNKFLGLEFASELNKVVDHLDEKRIRLAIKTALNNLKEVYKSDFLQNKKISKTIQKRIGIEEEMNEQLIEDKIIENMNNLRFQLKKIAEAEFVKAMNVKEFTKEDGMINYKHFFADAIKHKKVPNDLSLFMKYAVRMNDFKAVEYLNDLNLELGLDFIKIDNSTPLEFALKEEKNALALKMLKSGFILNYSELNKNEKDKKNIELALENILARKLKRA